MGLLHWASLLLLASASLASEEVCTRLATSLTTKAERMAEACEAKSAECSALASDYHVQYDAYRELCLSSPGNGTWNASTTAMPINGSTPSWNASTTSAPNHCLNNGTRHCPTSNGCFCVCPSCFTGQWCESPSFKPWCGQNTSTPMPNWNTTANWNMSTTGNWNMSTPWNFNTTSMPWNYNTTWYYNASTTAAPWNLTTPNPSCPPCFNGGFYRNGSCDCWCTSCYWGTQCQHRFGNCGNSTTPSPSPCQPNPCQNGGTGFPNGNRCECACAQGYYGIWCQNQVPTTVMTVPQTTTQACHCVRKFFGFCLKWDPPHCHDFEDWEVERLIKLCTEPNRRPILNHLCNTVQF